MVDCLRKFLKEVKIGGHVTKVLLSDGGKEFNCEFLQRVFEEYGITHRLAMPYTPEQNSAAEQENRAIVESDGCVLQVCGLPKGPWAEAPNTAVYILNRTGLHQWNCGLDHMQLFVTCVFSGQNVLCTSRNRRVTSGTQRVRRVNWSDMWVKRTAVEFGCLTNGRLW